MQSERVCQTVDPTSELTRESITMTITVTHLRKETYVFNGKVFASFKRFNPHIYLVSHINVNSDPFLEPSSFYCYNIF